MSGNSTSCLWYEYVCTLLYGADMNLSTFSFSITQFVITIVFLERAKENGLERGALSVITKARWRSIGRMKGKRYFNEKLRFFYATSLPFP